jgi:hypothetical protein
VKVSSTSIGFWGDEHDKLDAYNAKIAEVTERLFLVMAESSPEEYERLADLAWNKSTNRPVEIPDDAPAELKEYARLFDARRRVFPKLLLPRPIARRPRGKVHLGARPTRPRRVTVGRRSREVRTAAPSRGDPDDPDPDRPGPTHISRVLARYLLELEGRSER